MAEYRRPERKPKKTTVDDKDPNVSDDEESYGRGRGRYVPILLSCRVVFNVLFMFTHVSLKKTH